jgi:hypothetical protein
MGGIIFIAAILMTSAPYAQYQNEKEFLGEALSHGA